MSVCGVVDVIQSNTNDGLVMSRVLDDGLLVLDIPKSSHVVR